jgi:hypothetical protein
MVAEREEDQREAAIAKMHGTWAGLSLLEELNLAELRAILAVPLDAKTTTRKVLAAEVGISVYMLTSFLDGGNLREPDYNRVAAWCADKPTPQVSPYVVAVGLLCHWLRPRQVGPARRAVWATIRRMYASKGVSIPPFATAEVDVLFLPPARQTPDNLQEHPQW